MSTERSGPFRFIDKFSEAAPKTNPQTMESELTQRLATLRKQQGTYQPIYGIDSEEDTPRRELLTQNCQFVADHFAAVKRKQQIRILDIGSNAGFVTFTLANTFQQTLGAETDSSMTDLCHLLAQKTRSPARFAHINILDLIEGGSVDFENLDCVLLFNVIHQMIFARGLGYVQTALNRIVQSVDVVFIELATREQYVPHKKDHLLPIEAEEVLKKCVDCDIRSLRTAPRPLYMIRRRSLRFAYSTFPYSSIGFSANENRNISRKYYSNGLEFLKLYRFTLEQADVAFHAEVRGLLALQGHGVCPEIIDWGMDASVGYIRMERIYGQALSHQFARYNSKPKRDRLVAELLRLAEALARAGVHQNDFTAHNIFVQSDGSLRLVDFEQSRQHALRDPFALLLWLISDIHTGRADWYERCNAENFRLSGENRADLRYYPDKKEMVAAGLNPSFVDDAFSASDWKQFVTKWHAEFQPYNLDTPDSRI